MKIKVVLFNCFFAMQISLGQGIAINNLNLVPDPSAILDISSTSQGVLIPRMTMGQRDAIPDPADGLMVFITDGTPGLFVFTSENWNVMTTSENVWSTGGNGGTDPGNNFIGTTDGAPLRIKVNNRWAGEIDLINQNISLGDSAGMNLNGFNNVAIGDKAMRNSTAGWQNVAIGSQALVNNNNINNTAVGYQTLTGNLGYSNTAIGAQCLYKNIGGIQNTGLGYGALYSNEDGFENTAVGALALFANRSGTSNTSIGFNAGYANTVGYENTSVGHKALYANISGFGNTAIGTAALQNTTNAKNTAVGFRSSLSTVGGNNNTAVGAHSLEANVTGYYNTAIGNYALWQSNGQENTALGYSALQSVTNGSGNVAAGMLASAQNTSGQYNTAVGYEALKLNATGDYNIAIGPGSGTHASYPDLYNTIGLGNNGSLQQINNQVIIGNAAIAHNGGYQPWEVYSDGRIKFDVREDVVGLNFIKRLRPVTYRRRVDAGAQITGDKVLPDFPGKYEVESIRQTGFIAQEVDTAAMGCGYEFSGIAKPRHEQMLYALSYDSFVVPLVKAVQEQQAMIDTQKQTITTQEDIIQKQQAMIDALIEGYIDHETRLTTIEGQKTK